MENLMVKIVNLIMDNIIIDISEGRYKHNNKLPSDNELADKYGVSRIKIRRVYERLEAMGYIYSLQGIGRFLKDKNKIVELVLSGDESFIQKIKEKGYDLISKNIFCDRVSFNKKIYDKLGTSRSSEVYRIGRLRIVEDEPIAIHISYVSNRIFPNTFEDGKEVTSMFKYYKSKGFNSYVLQGSLLSITYPTFKERAYFNCGELVPLLKLETSCIDKVKEIVLEYTEILYRGEKFKYKI